MTVHDEWRWTDERGVQRLVGTDELRAALANRVLPPSTLVWREGMDDWLPASKMPELASAVPGVDDGGVREPPQTPPVREPPQTPPDGSTGTPGGDGAPNKGNRQTMPGLAAPGAPRPVRRSTLVGLPAPTPAATPPKVPITVPGTSPDGGRRSAITQVPSYGGPHDGGGKGAKPAVALIPRAPRLPVTEAPEEIKPKRRTTMSEIDRLWSAPTSDEDETLPRKRPGEEPAPKPEAPIDPAAKAEAEAKAREAEARAQTEARTRAAAAQADVFAMAAAMKPAAKDPPAKEPSKEPTLKSARAERPPKPPGAAPPDAIRLVPRKNPLAPPVGDASPATQTARSQTSSAKAPLRVPPPPPPKRTAPKAFNDTLTANPPPLPTRTEPTSTTLPSADLLAIGPPPLPAETRAPEPAAPAAAPPPLPPARAPVPSRPPPAASAEPAPRAPIPSRPPVPPADPIPETTIPLAPRAPHPSHPPPAASAEPAPRAPQPSHPPVQTSPSAHSEPPAARAPIPSQPPPARASHPSHPPPAAHASQPPPAAHPSIPPPAALPSVPPPGAAKSLRPPPLKGPVPVPMSSLFGAGGALICMVVASFFAGRCSASQPAPPRAHASLGVVPALARAALPPPPQPCWVAKQPVMWAPKASKNIPFELTATQNGKLAVGYARTSDEAMGIEVDPATGAIVERFARKEKSDIGRVVPSAAVEFAVTHAEGGGALKSAVEVAAPKPFAVGLQGGSIAIADRPDGVPAPLWPLSGDEGLGAATVIAAGDRGHALVFRREGAIFGGLIGPDRRAVGSVVKVVGSGGAVGKPAAGWNGRELAVIFADRPEGSSSWEIRLGHAPAGAIPASTATFPLPKGGPGGDAFAPDIAGLPDGRWLMIWTEGASGSRAVRAQTLASDFSVLGDPIALSPPAGNYGQGAIGVVGGYAAVMFLSKGSSSYELWGAVLRCGS